MTRAVRAWLPAALWAAVLFAASSRPTLPVDLDSGLDKVAHFAAYLVFGLLLARGRRSVAAPAFVVPLLGLGFALTDELHQGLVPGRVPDLADWVADALGVLAGHALYRLGGVRRTPTPSHPVTDSASR